MELNDEFSYISEFFEKDPPLPEVFSKTGQLSEVFSQTGAKTISLKMPVNTGTDFFPPAVPRDILNK